MASKNYFRIAGVFIVVYILTTFLEFFELPIWINLIALIIFSTFSILGYYKKKKEDEADTKENL